MRKLLIITLISFTGAYLNAQTNLDSLFTIWNDQSQADTTRLEAMQKIAWDGYIFTQPDSAFFFAQMQYDFAEKKGLKKDMANALNTQGGSFYLRGDYPQALDYFQRSLEIHEERGDKKGIAGSLNNVGNIYQNQGDYPKALDYYQKSLKIREEMGDKKGIAASLGNIGIIFRNQGDYTQALDYFQRSLKVREEIGDKNGIAATLGNIGIIYRNQGDDPQALDYFQRSLKIYDVTGDKNGIANSVNNIGNIYANQGDYPQAHDYYQKSLKIQEEIGDKNGIASSLGNIGVIYKNQGNYPQALNYFQSSLKVREEIGDKNGIARSLNNIGGLYQKNGSHQKAIDQCSKGLLLAQDIGSVSLQRSSCKCLYDAYKAMGNSIKALAYHEQMLVLDDSLQAEETQKKLQQMEFQKAMLQDSIAKSEEARLLQEAHEEEMRQGEQNRNVFIVASLLLLLIAVGFYVRWRYVRKSRAILQVEKDRSENLLLNILPEDIAAELKEKGKADARDFEMVSILFTDFKGFTEQSAKLSAADLVNEINICFEAFDGIMEKYGIEKIKTIGDAYMAAGGLPDPTDDSVKNTVLAALEMQAFISKRKSDMDAAGKPAFEMRVGIHTGPVVAGIVGIKKFQYDIWGDTVNTASRMESNGEVGKVNISQASYGLLKNDPDFAFESRGELEVKGKGRLGMYFVSKA